MLHSCIHGCIRRPVGKKSYWRPFAHGVFALCRRYIATGEWDYPLRPSGVAASRQHSAHSPATLTRQDPHKMGNTNSSKSALFRFKNTGGVLAGGIRDTSKQFFTRTDCKGRIRIAGPVTSRPPGRAQLVVRDHVTCTWSSPCVCGSDRLWACVSVGGLVMGFAVYDCVGSSLMCD